MGELASMELLDEEGDLVGLANAVDIPAVVFVAVLLIGAALLVAVPGESATGCILV